MQGMRPYGLLLVPALLLASCNDNDDNKGGPGTLAFAANAVNVAENAGSVTLKLSRTGGSRGAVGLSFSTADGTATSPADYAATTGTVTWADGETGDKNITVTLANDSSFEEDESFTVTLASPTGEATLATATATVTINDDDPVPVRLLSFNDYHGNLEAPGSTIRAPLPTEADPAAAVNLPAGGVEYLSTLVKQLKGEVARTTVVAAGDLIGASPLISALFHDEPAIETLNELGLEFSSVGNHEFDDGSTELKRVQDGGCLAEGGNTTCQNGTFAGAKFQYLAANVFDTATGQTVLPAYRIKEFDVGNGQKIGVAFIGLVLKGTPNIVTPTGVAGLEFRDEADSANALIDEIKAQGVQAIVVLVHEGATTTGLYNDRSCPGLSGDVLPIVNKLDPAIDIIISGHTHSAYNCTVGGRVLTSASSFGRVLTRIDLALDRTTKDFVVPAEAANNLVVVNDTAANPAPAAYPALAKDAAQSSIVNHYKTLVAPLANAVVGRISGDLTRDTTAAGESVLGDVIADSQLAATSAAEFGGAVAAFMNPGGIRADFLSSQISGGEAAGEITYGEAFTVQPFGNTLTTLTLTGAQIKTLLEQQFPPNQTAPRLLQVSQGFSYRYSASGPDNNKVDASSIRINGVTVDPAATYRITVNNFLATGGDGFVVLKEGSNQLGGAVDVDALIDYFEAHSPIAQTARDRYTLLP